MNYSTLSPAAEAHIVVFARNDGWEALRDRTGLHRSRIDGSPHFGASHLNFSDTGTTKMERIERANLVQGLSAERYSM